MHKADILCGPLALTLNKTFPSALCFQNIDCILFRSTAPWTPLEHSWMFSLWWRKPSAAGFSPAVLYLFPPPFTSVFRFTGFQCVTFQDSVTVGPTQVHTNTHTHTTLSLSLRLAHTPMHTCLAHMCPIMHSNSCDCVHASTHKAHLQKNTRWKYSIWIVHLTVIVQLEHSCICIDLMEVYICTRTNTQTHTSFLDYAVSVLLVVYADWFRLYLLLAYEIMQ